MSGQIYAVRVHTYGGPEVLGYEPVELGEPEANEVRIRQRAAGVNYTDIYHRRGEAKPPSGLPFTDGFEGVGTIEQLGSEVDSTRLPLGARVGYTLAIGGYATHRNVAAARLVTLPDTLSDEQAAAVLLKGTTAEYLVRRLHAVKPGDVVLVHAAAGGVGLLLTQWAKYLGATVIGTAGTKAKAEIARTIGRCDETFLIADGTTSWADDIRAKFGETPVTVVYDGIAGPTLQPSLDLLAVRGLAVVLGSAGGTAAPINVHALKARSLSVTSPSLPHFTGTAEDFQESTSALFSAITAGAITVPEPQVYALADAARAHEDIEARRTAGPVVLRVD
jgi:NADPH:quinone reductase